MSLCTLLHRRRLLQMDGYLPRAHGRLEGSVVALRLIGGYLGSKDAFDEAMGDFEGIL